MAEERQNRRATDRLEDKIDKLCEQHTGLLGMLTHHAGEEERDLKDIKEQLGGFFHELTAHTHIYHHQFVAGEIDDKEKADTRWEKIKTGVLEKAIIFLMGGLATYIFALVWVDFGDKIRKPAEKSTIPSSYQVPLLKLGPQQPTQTVLYIPGVKDVAAAETNH